MSLPINRGECKEVNRDDLECVKLMMMRMTFDCDGCVGESI